ncbi:transmembrane protein 18-domain-containing protein [Polychytrium aggregatum]|uniref:transmembrane protein 18-domain-containing protein n=1 Tax=Polychytrium aggregatum TaxID=110093 RepID=UPI0022FED3FC|nr:transmembrane protein 18-domain-containing protein [Polychytrium aggregatum]KAI9207457.1 transmembrane protein 18-domain-containing protein [Polychytrium aggregatum]
METLRNVVSGLSQRFYANAEILHRIVSGQGPPEYAFNPDDSNSIHAAIREFLKDSQSFYKAVDWTEPFLLAFGLLHIAIFIAALLARKSLNGTIVVFFAIGLLIILGEPLNRLASKHHAAFANTNYFDANGVFMTTVFSLPLLINMLVVLIVMLGHLFSVMAKAKAAQLKSQNHSNKRKSD